MPIVTQGSSILKNLIIFSKLIQKYNSTQNPYRVLKHGTLQNHSKTHWNKKCVRKI